MEKLTSWALSLDDFLFLNQLYTLSFFHTIPPNEKKKKKRAETSHTMKEKGLHTEIKKQEPNKMKEEGKKEEKIPARKDMIWVD